MMEKTESVSSVALEVGAKGDIKPVVKVYNIDPFEAERLASEVLKKALGRIKAGEYN